MLAGLPALRCFELCSSVYTSGSLAAISSLTTITRLRLDRVESLPPQEALAALAGSLRVLEVHSLTLNTRALNDGIQVLTGLESLALDLADWEDHSPSVPPAVAALPQLQRCSLTFYCMDSGAPLQGAWLPPLAALPFDSLRWLALPLQLALASQPVLAQAHRLHTLCLELSEMETSDAYDSGQWAGFWRFVASHPPLRCLLYQASEGEDPGPAVFMLLDALLLLQRRRPALEVRRLVDPADRIDSPPACWAEMHASA